MLDSFIILALVLDAFFLANEIIHLRAYVWVFTSADSLKYFGDNLIVFLFSFTFVVPLCLDFAFCKAKSSL